MLQESMHIRGTRPEYARVGGYELRLVINYNSKMNGSPEIRLIGFLAFIFTTFKVLKKSFSTL